MSIDADIASFSDLYCTMCGLPFADRMVSMLLSATARSGDTRDAHVPHFWGIAFLHDQCVPRSDEEPLILYQRALTRMQFITATKAEPIPRTSPTASETRN